MFRQSNGSSAAYDIAENFPSSAGGSKEDKYLPLVVSRQIIDIFVSLTKFVTRIYFYVHGGDNGMEVDGTEPRESLSLFERMRDLL